MKALLLPLAIALILLVPLHAGAQSKFFSTPNRGAAEGAKGNAQLTTLQNEFQRMSSCTVQGWIYAPTHPVADPNGCLPEQDPRIGILTNGHWCRTNGSQVICDQQMLTSNTANAGVLRDGSGGFYAGHIRGTVFSYSSDARLKDRVEAMSEAEIIDVLTAVNGHRFRWRKTGVSSIGFIAQEIEAVLPELVHTDPETGMKTVDYPLMTAVLFAAVRQLYCKGGYIACDAPEGR